jgi:ribosomal-protein-alanine N-acetyltransferase
LSAEPGSSQVWGDRVWIDAVTEGDIAPYRRAVEQSRPRLASWNPVDPDDLARGLLLPPGGRRTFLIHALIPEGDHDIVGKVNVSDLVRGRFESAAIGYDAYDPYAGRGLFAEGLRLVLNVLFRPQDVGGMGLHRVQAAVQPGNVRSAGLLRSLGFAREGFSPRMLWLPDATGHEAWRDHDSYVVLRDEWPAQPYRPVRSRVLVVLVNGAAESAATRLAGDLAAELRIPLFSLDVLEESRPGALWGLLAASPVGGVLQGHFRPDDERAVTEGLRSCGLDPTAVPEVWCFSSQGGGPRVPLGLGPTVAFDMGGGVGRADVVRIALQVGAEGA